MTSQTMIFSHSSFFKEQRAKTLPTPDEVRAINRETGGDCGTDFDRPPPVSIPSLGLFVKYGGDISIVEAQTQVIVRETLKDQVPVPEIFGWTRDKNQTFIYMSLVEGETLMVRWHALGEIDRLKICAELRSMVNVWRTIVQQERGEFYIGKQDILNHNIHIQSNVRIQGALVNCG